MSPKERIISTVYTSASPERRDEKDERRREQAYRDKDDTLVEGLHLGKPAGDIGLDVVEVRRWVLGLVISEGCRGRLTRRCRGG